MTERTSFTVNLLVMKDLDYIHYNSLYEFVYVLGPCLLSVTAFTTFKVVSIVSHSWRLEVT
jgi:hypothetical protein